MTDNIKVSVITATYNGERFITKAIQSVLNQSFKNFEYIIINDCSKDNTKNIIEKLAKQDKRIKLVNNEKNMERSWSRNHAASLANGEFLAFIDDDDVWADPDKLKKQVEFFEKNKEYCLLGTNVKIVNENFEIMSKRLSFRESDDKIRQAFLKTNSFVFSSVMVRKDCFLKVGGFDESQFLAEDYELWLKMGRLGKMHNIKNSHVWYMDRGSNTSSQFKNKIKINFKGLKFCIKYRKDYPNFTKNLISKIFSLVIPSKFYEWKAKREKLA